jgi:OMF family outer membrane factor
MNIINNNKQLFFLLLILFAGQTMNAQVWTLKQCIDTAQVRNINLQMNKNNIALAEQREKEAVANLIPKINLNADYKYFTNLPYQLMPLSVFGGQEGKFKEAQFGVPHNINTTLQFTMPLYNPNIYGAIQTTKIASELSELQYHKTEEQVFFEISNLFFNAQILHHQLAFIDGNLSNATFLLENIKLLNEHLLAKGTDVSKVQLQVTQLATQKENIKSKYEQVLNALKFAMGISIEENLTVDTNIEYQNPFEYINSSTIDIRLVTTQHKLISSELSTLKYSRLPSLSLIGTYGTTGFGYDKQPNDFLKFFPIGFVGVQFSFPLFNGTITHRKINQKTIELQNNELQTTLLIEQNKMQIDNAKLQRTIAQNSVPTIEEQIKLAQTIYQQTVLQQKQGTANLTDVLLADNALREAQQSYLNSIVDFLKADLELKKLTGNISSIRNN